MIKRQFLNMELLDLIILVQDHHNYKGSEFRLLGDISKDDPKKDTQKYYNSLPDELLSKYGLSKNNTSFNRILKYPITEEILNTDEQDLDNFYFK